MIDGLLIVLGVSVVACTALTVYAACALAGQVDELDESMARFDAEQDLMADDGGG